MVQSVLTLIIEDENVTLVVVIAPNDQIVNA